MVGSNWANKKIDNDYAHTVKVRAGYEIRDYTPGIFIGKPINFDKALWWTEVDQVKEDIKANNIQIVDYPYFIRQKTDGTTEVFFNIVKGSAVESFEGFSVAFPLTNTAFHQFKWYPGKGTIEKNYSKLIQSISENQLDYNKEEFWIEVRNHHLTIPFMMENGVFVDLNEL